jgi:hypothetical protein
VTAIFALILDAYRDLNAKRLFWISLVVSLVLVLMFAGVAPVQGGLSIFGWHAPLEFGFGLNNSASFYKFMFVHLGIELWICWAAMIMAVASTAGMFPDFLASGAVELYLARPISRLRLFLVKYFCGLLFFGLQVGVFTTASFFAIGLRGGVWEPGLFLAIPLSVLLFSYLFGVCALAGVLTRSTVAAILITLAFWLIMGSMQFGERQLLYAQLADRARAAQLDQEIADLKTEIQKNPSETQPAADAPTTQLSDFGQEVVYFLGRSSRDMLQTPPERLKAYQYQRANLTQDYELPHQLIYWADWPLPKTSATVTILQHELLSAARLPPTLEDEDATDPGAFRVRRRDQQIARAQVDQEMRSRSAGGIIGTSLLFEAVVVSLAAWLFCKRDY